MRYSHWMRYVEYPRGQKRRKVKQWARYWIKYSLYKYGVKRIKDIPCDYHYEMSVWGLRILGYKYDYKTDTKTKL